MVFSYITCNMQHHNTVNAIKSLKLGLKKVGIEKQIKYSPENFHKDMHVNLLAFAATHF